MSLSKAIVIVLFILALLGGLPKAGVCADEPAHQEAKQEQNPYEYAELTTKIIPSVNNTFGYDVFLYGKPLVHQPHIPGLPGNQGFTTKEKAQTVADFVVQKIRRNEMPPTVAVEDLNRMGVMR